MARLITLHTADDWRAVSAAGAPISTFGSADIAAAWVEAEGSKWPGYRIVRIRTRITEETGFDDPQAALDEQEEGIG